jgi:hypothetical protein
MDRRTMMGLIVAGAVVSFVSTSHGLAADKAKPETAKTVKCSGINECKGKGECASPDGSSSCSGKNACKGKGWVKVADEKACTDKGGTVLKDKKKDS